MPCHEPPENCWNVQFVSVVLHRHRHCISYTGIVPRTADTASDNRDEKAFSACLPMSFHHSRWVVRQHWVTSSSSNCRIWRSTTHRHLCIVWQMRKMMSTRSGFWVITSLLGSWLVEHTFWGSGQPHEAHAVHVHTVTFCILQPVGKWAHDCEHQPNNTAQPDQIISNWGCRALDVAPRMDSRQL